MTTNKMRKEILGVIFTFVLIFVTVSLLSYHPSDPSINRIQVSGELHNLFGPAGAHTAGFLVFLFGLGAFWMPVVLCIVTVYIFKGLPKNTLLISLAGGVLLMITTGAFLSLYQTHYTVMGKRFSSGGIVGIPLARIVESYISTTGSFVFLVTAWIIAFIMTTRVSLVAFGKAWAGCCVKMGSHIKSSWAIYKERRHRASKLKSQRRDKGTAKARRSAPKIVEPPPKRLKESPPPRQEVFDFMNEDNGFKLPSISLLDPAEDDDTRMDRESLQMQSRLLEKKLNDFDVSGRVVAVTPGPVVTMYEYEPAPGVKINRIVNLADDLSLALRAASIRIVAPIPGKSVIGIEVPNDRRATVKLREVIASNAFQQSKSKLTLALGKDIMGEPFVANLHKMPHLLIAGATGSGKSVGLNSMICSILYKASPQEVKLLLIDPKRIELSAYDGIPHLIVPVVTDVKKATKGLMWAVQEMENRYSLMAEKKVRNIFEYNQKITKETGASDGRKKPPNAEGTESEEGKANETLPIVLIVIDELADLMLAASRDVELALTRLAQMARAAGIHLIIATQRPSVDVLTGTIKANFPTRVSFQVSSRTDSRTIIDANGAEDLLGSGDMLLLPPGTAKLQRIHGAYVSEAEIHRVIGFLKKQRRPVYREEILKTPPEGASPGDTDSYDEKYDEAVALVAETRQASISMIQRRLRIGYNRAARIMETMEREGVVSAGEGSKPREVLVKGYGL